MDNNENLSCSPKRFILCECTGNSVINNEIMGLDFFWPGPPPKSGQFFLIRPERSSVFLCRPLSVAAWMLPGTINFLFSVRGKGTKELSSMRPGEKAFLAGPLGKGWDRKTGVNIALVSGGIGMAPLAFFASGFENQSYDFFAGYRNAQFGLDGLKPARLVISSENGAAANKGLITGFFDPRQYGVVYTCGPEPMMKAVAEKCRAAGVACYVSLERRMACGIGACLGCSVKTRNGNRRCCLDGPVFNAEDVFFD